MLIDFCNEFMGGKEKEMSFEFFMHKLLIEKKSQNQKCIFVS